MPPRAGIRKVPMKGSRGDVLARNRLAKQPQGARVIVGDYIYERTSQLGLNVQVTKIGKAPKY